MTIPVQRIVFANGHFGAKEQSGSTNATNINASEKISMELDAELGLVTVTEQLRDGAVRFYYVPITSLCQIYPDKAEKKAAKK